MNQVKRLTHGRPIPGHTANAADTVALLAGVNLASVVKVLTALSALQLSTAKPFSDLVQVQDLPLSAVKLTVEGREARMKATQRLAQSVATDPRVGCHDSILNMRDRV